MARRRHSRRRGRGRFGFLLKLLATVVAVAAMVWAVTLFFRMDHIAVSGNIRYSEQEILEASGLETGRNLYFINKFDVKEAIFDQLPYVEEVKINRKLPDTLLIEVRESEAVAAVESGEEVWMISEQGKLLETVDKAPEKCPIVRGGELLEPEATKTVDFGEEASYRVGVMLTLLRLSGEKNMRGDIGVIELSDETALSFTYLGRFTVRTPWTADIGYKLESLATVVDYLENNETGRIDLMTEGKASFIPG